MLDGFCERERLSRAITSYKNMTMDRNPDSKVESQRMLVGFGALVCAFYVYSSGYFRFWEVLGVERQVQTLLLGIILVLFTPHLVGRRYRTSEIWLILLPLSFLLSEIFMRRQMLMIADLVVAAILVGVVLAQDHRFVRSCLKAVVVVGGTFAIMGLVQFVAILVDPALRAYAELEGTFNEAGGVLVRHPFGYLGQATYDEFEILGLIFPRLFSFAAEPSVVIFYFMIPGALALTLTGRCRLWAIPLLILSAVSLSGTVNAAFLLTALCLPVLLTTKRAPVLAALAPIAIAVSVVMILETVGTDPFVTSFRFAEEHSFLPSKLHSGTERLVFIQRHWTEAQNVLQHPLGLHEPPQGGWSSLPLMTLLYFGIPGFLVQVSVLFTLFKTLAKAFHVRHDSLLTRIGLLLTFGVFTEATAGSSYGFISAGAVFMEVLTILWARELVRRSEMVRQWTLRVPLTKSLVRSQRVLAQ